MKSQPKEYLQGSDPPPAQFSQAIKPLPPSCENFQFAIHRGDVFFWNNLFAFSLSCKLHSAQKKLEHFHWNMYPIIPANQCQKISDTFLNKMNKMGIHLLITNIVSGGRGELASSPNFYCLGLLVQ